jgi:ubiquinone/menaquinone biosynthesis C-methylase UbiE
VLEFGVSAVRSAKTVVVSVCLLGAGFALGHWVGGSADPAPAPAPAPGTALELPAVAASPSKALEALGRVNPQDSLVYYPFLDLVEPSQGAFAVAQDLLGYLDSGDRALLEQARTNLVQLQEVENWGGEYATLQWFCEYALADASGQAALLANDDGRRFAELFGGDDWALLREYLHSKYRPRLQEFGRQWYLDEIIRFNSPYRERWERSDRVLEAMALEPGMQVADIGSGPGFYSFRFADRVGSAGRVYAVEMNTLHLDYVSFVAASEGLDQIVVTPTEGAFPQVEDGSLDRVFLCAAYQTLYLAIRSEERSAWITAMKRALAPDGLLVVSENEPQPDPGVVPFAGISLSQPLLEAQLVAWGFELVSTEHFVDQRYTMVLRKAE